MKFLLNEYYLNVPVNEEDEDIDIDNPQPETPSDPNNVQDTLQNVTPDNMMGVDVTQLVQRQDEILQKFNDVIGKLGLVTQMKDNIDKIFQQYDQSGNKVDEKLTELENEMKKRMPTKEEKMKLQSLHSYPYNVRLDDYFDQDDTAEKSDVDDYILKVSDIEKGYNETDIKNSF